jgi:hypothetical protein
MPDIHRNQTTDYTDINSKKYEILFIPSVYLIRDRIFMRKELVK